MTPFDFLREANLNYSPSDLSIAEWAATEVKNSGCELLSDDVIYAFDEYEDALNAYENWKKNARS